MYRFENICLQIVLILTIITIQANTLEEIRSERDLHRTFQGKVYFAIAVSTSGQGFSRAFNKTLSNITHNHLFGSFKKSSYNISLEPLLIELPENGSFSSFLLEHICDMFEGKQVVAVLVVGSSPAAFTVSVTARHAGIPVLWARGQSEFLPGFRTLLEEDMENYMKFKLMGGNKKMKPGVVPHILQCQPDRKRAFAQSTRVGALKRARRQLVQEAVPSTSVVPEPLEMPVLSKRHQTMRMIVRKRKCPRRHQNKHVLR